MLGDAAPFLYFELLPPPALALWIQAYWGFDVRASTLAEHTVWPDGCLSLLCRVRPGEPVSAAFSGPRSEPLRVIVSQGEKYRGVRFWPWAVPSLLGCNPVAFRSRTGSAHEVIGAEASAFSSVTDAREVLPAMERILLPLAARAAAPDPVVRAAVRAISDANGSTRISSVAQRVGRSERQLRRRFRAVTGLSPKEYARVRRLRVMGQARLVHRHAWSELAAHFGYADQAHLVREIASMTGLTPTAFEQRLQLIEHRGTRP